MLRKIRIAAAVIFFTIITFLFLDFTGTLHHWFGWMAKIQFLPALLALNVGVIIALVLLTLLFGRIYCSVICPLGVFQDTASWIAGRWKKRRFSYSPALSYLRYGILAVFIIALVAGFSSFAALLAPYSAYGRIASNLFAPVYQWINNALAYFAERADSYAFYSVDVWMKGGFTFAVAIITFVVLIILAVRNGRTYCNTICPVGTVLGFLSRFSFFKPVIHTEKCISCGLCARNCKASCISIDPKKKEQKIDYSRCVTCFNCIETCKHGAIRYERRHKTVVPAGQPADNNTSGKVDNTRRSFLSVLTLFAASSALKAQEKVDGGKRFRTDKPRSFLPEPKASATLRNIVQHANYAYRSARIRYYVLPANYLR